jgi:hypothetical protein
MCLNVGTLATVYLKPVNQVFRSARPRRLQDSPALQKHELPTVKAAQQARDRSAAERTKLDTTTNGNGHLSPTSANGMANAVSDADMYFASVGRQSTFGGSPVADQSSGAGGGWVVNQNEPQHMVMSPGPNDGNQDLLL